MRLTRRKAIELCIEMWTWLAETGKLKAFWPEWEKYGDIDNECWFCEYVKQTWDNDCHKCPLLSNGDEEYLCEVGDKSQYALWARARTTAARKKYAKLFLAQIREIPIRKGAK